MRRKIEEKNIRKIFKCGDSYAVTLPKDLVRSLKWQEKQKVIIKRHGSGMKIIDWE